MMVAAGNDGRDGCNGLLAATKFVCRLEYSCVLYLYDGDKIEPLWVPLMNLINLLTFLTMVNVWIYRPR